MIFLSYSRENSADAVLLREELNNNRYSLLSDRPLVEGDPFWRQKIKNGWKDCELMIVLWSIFSLQSPWVDQEIRAFDGLKVLLTLDDTAVPPSFGGLKMKPNEILTFLRRLNFSDILSLDDPGIDSTEILAQRISRIHEWQGMLDRTGIKENIGTPSQVSENDWLLENNIALKPIEPLSNPFYNGKNIKLLSPLPVTNKQFSIFAKESGWPAPKIWGYEDFKIDDFPVVGISWYDAMAYARWYGGSLPSTADWEMAAGGSQSQVVYATNDNSLSTHNSFFSRPFGTGKPIDPRIYPPNPAGFYGMSGNTWDWCLSRQGQHYAIKGGGFMDSERFCRIGSGYRNSPIDRDCCVGFRVLFDATI